MNAVKITVHPSGALECGHGFIVGRPCSACDRLAAEALHWWTSSSGRIEFQMTREQAESVSHGGQCDADTGRVLCEMAARGFEIDRATLAAELKEYGAWDAEELADHHANLTRLVWIAGNDIAERGFID